MSKQKIIKAMYGLSLLLILIAVATAAYLIILLDISKATPYRLNDTQKQTDYYLITYANGADVYLQNRNMLSSSATNNGFDNVINYRREHIDPKYIEQHPILKEKMGDGYWLWKPYLILKTLQRMPDGAVLMYADSGMFIRRPVRDYLDAGLSHEDILLFNYDHESNGYAGAIANGDTFAAINCLTEKCRYGHHLWAGIVVVRNSSQSRRFIEQWLKYCEDTQLLTGLPNKVANYPEFVHQQHDEGILSVLAAREADQIRFVQMDREFSKHFKVHRRKSSDTSLLRYVLSGSIIYRD